MLSSDNSFYISTFTAADHNNFDGIFEMDLDTKPNEETTFLRKIALSLSGTKLRQLLSKNEPVPSWFSFPEIINELRAAYPTKSELGFTLFFTGGSRPEPSKFPDIF